MTSMRSMLPLMRIFTTSPYPFLLASFFLAISYSLPLSYTGPDQLKPCFEHYDGRKLFEAVPFHSEWRMKREEACLPFCARTAATRCISIVYDKIGHICHYFTVNGTEENAIERSGKMVYMQVADNTCIDDMLAAMDSTEEENKHNSDPNAPPSQAMGNISWALRRRVSSTTTTSSTHTSEVPVTESGIKMGNKWASPLQNFLSTIDSMLDNNETGNKNSTTSSAEEVKRVNVEAGSKVEAIADGQESESSSPPTTVAQSIKKVHDHESKVGSKSSVPELPKPDSVDSFVPVMSGFKAVRRPGTVSQDVDSSAGAASGGRANESGGDEQMVDTNTDSPPVKKTRKEGVEIRRHPINYKLEESFEQLQQVEVVTPTLVEPATSPQPSPMVEAMDDSVPSAQEAAEAETTEASPTVEQPPTMNESNPSPAPNAGITDYDISSCIGSNLNQVWLAVENSQVKPTLLSSTGAYIPLEKSAPAGATECIQTCVSLAAQGLVASSSATQIAANEAMQIDVASATTPPAATTCDSFTYLEKERQCVFHSLGENFPHPAIEPAQQLDYSSRLFHRLCFPSNLPPFTDCSEFITFRDYTLEITPREIFNGLPPGREGLSACVELCVLASEYQCKSASFDSKAGICQVFDEHSLSKPGDFREHQLAGVLYFENGCADSQPVIGGTPTPLQTKLPGMEQKQQPEAKRSSRKGNTHKGVKLDAGGVRIDFLL